jgi:hypothetical protein
MKRFKIKNLNPEEHAYRAMTVSSGGVHAADWPAPSSAAGPPKKCLHHSEKACSISGNAGGQIFLGVLCDMDQTKGCELLQNRMAARPSAAIVRAVPIKQEILVKMLLRKRSFFTALHRSAPTPSTSLTALLPAHLSADHRTRGEIGRCRAAIARGRQR